MKKIIPEKLFDLKSFGEVCPAEHFFPLTNFDINLFIKRHNVIIHIDENDPYPFDVEFNGDLEYCGKERNFKLYKINFGKQQNKLIFLVNQKNVISRIVTVVDVTNPAAVESFAGIITVILRNVGLSVSEIQAVNSMVKNDEDKIFHWCAETERFVLINTYSEENICHMGFFAAIE